MARPAAEILNHTAIGRTHYDLTIKAAAGLWVVTYEDQPFQLVKSHRYRPDLQPKYQRTSWPNPQAPTRLAQRLNQYFNTDKFSVKCVK